MAVIELRAAPTRSGVGLRTYAASARIADILLMLVATSVGWAVWNDDSTVPRAFSLHDGYLLWAAPIVLAWYVLLETFDAYDLERIGSAADELRAVFNATLLVAAGSAVNSFLFRLPLSRTFFVVAFALGMVLLLLAHLVVRQMLAHAHARGMYMRPVVAVGGRGPVTDLVKELERSPTAGLQVVAACVPEEEAWDPIGEVPWVLPTSTLHEVVKDSGATHVFLLRGAGETPRHVRRIAWSLEGTGAHLAVVPHLTDIAAGRIRPRPVAGLPLIELEQPDLSGPDHAAKRVLDIAGSACGLLMLAPLFAVLAYLIKREDGGPIFFRQERVGRDGAAFECLKFRSMHVDAAEREAQLRAQIGHHGARFKLQRDPRITNVGHFIRRYSLDELPQLINVLRGDMSLVGPRPQQRWEVETYHPDMTRRLKVRPGMTGLWQVSGRSDLSAEESERLDLYYVDNWSLAHDLMILFKTVRVVLTGSGAY
jgi:exopolysaccharide biosynthesis polyprenyl glycosylphosphotransferase